MVGTNPRPPRESLISRAPIDQVRERGFLVGMRQQRDERCDAERIGRIELPVTTEVPRLKVEPSAQGVSVVVMPAASPGRNLSVESCRAEAMLPVALAAASEVP